LEYLQKCLDSLKLSVALLHYPRSDVSGKQGYS